MNIAASAYKEYPMELFFGLIGDGSEKSKAIPKKYPYGSSWGTPEVNFFEEPDSEFIPKSIDLVYLSVYEQKFYSLQAEIDSGNIVKELQSYKERYGESDKLIFIVGLGPGGLVVLWLEFDLRRVLIGKYTASQIEVPVKIYRALDEKKRIEDICARYSERIQPGRDIHIPKRAMRQYVYRYNVELKSEGEDLTVYVSLSDGGFEKAEPENLLKYHKAGMPKRLAIRLTCDKVEYCLYVWFDENEIIPIFERFYGAHPETKADFIIRMDVEKGEYALALFRQGLKEPVTIPEEAFQVIVFKDKFECYRSANYNQPKGAWIW